MEGRSHLIGDDGLDVALGAVPFCMRNAGVTTDLGRGLETAEPNRFRHSVLVVGMDVVGGPPTEKIVGLESQQWVTTGLT